MKIRKFLLSAIAITLVMSTLSGCSFFATKKVSSNLNEVSEEELVHDEETKDINDNGFLGLFDETEEETTKREYVKVDTINSIEEFKNLVSPLIDLSAYDVSEDTEGDSKGVAYLMKEDLRKQTSYNFRHTVTLGDGTEFILPATVGELKEQGWAISNDYAESSGYIYMTNSENNELKLYIDSSTINGNVDEYRINGYTINAYEDNRNIEYTVYEKLTKESDFIEIIEHLGAPTIVRFGIVDQGYGEVKSIEVYYIEGETFDEMTQFVISCGKTTYADGSPCEDYNGGQVNVNIK